MYMTIIAVHDWDQTSTDVTITLSAGKQLKAKDVDATFSPEICKISLSGKSSLLTFFSLHAYNISYTYYFFFLYFSFLLRG